MTARRIAVEASAPVRICDLGGWTDTWFGGPGRVVNVAVAPGATVSIRPANGPDPVVLNASDFEDRYPVVPGAPRTPRHPLLEAAVDSLAPPPGAPVEITVGVAVPAGCGAGTSASVAVALLGALTTLRGERRSPTDIARLAHHLETAVVGDESGVQDQLSAALGGTNAIEVDHYPEATVHPLPAWDELAAGLSLVFLGRGHDSTALHRLVVDRLADGDTRELARLREAAAAARRAVLDHDLEAFGRAMIANTDAQRSLHPALVGADAERAIGTARAEGAFGWKVNGAGGDGGSLTVLSGTAELRAAVERRLAGLDRRYRVLPVAVSGSGLVVRAGS